MPVKLEMLDVTNITLVSSATDATIIYVKSLLSDTVMGEFLVSTDGYTDGAEIVATGYGVYLEFEEGAAIDLAEGDVLTISYDATSIAVTLPGSLADGDILYIDNNGHIWLDKQLRQGALLVGATEEAISIAEAQEQMSNFGETEDTIEITESHVHDRNYEETVETINMSESHEHDENYDETSETITISEESFVERGITEETISVGEYNILFADDIYLIGKVITDLFRMKSGNVKTTQFIKLNLTDTSGVQVRVHYRMGSNDAWAQSSYVNVNSRGEAFIAATGIEFKIEIYTTDFTTVYAKGIKVSFKSIDKRSQRSPNAFPA